jgi:hypothetical protein
VTVRWALAVFGLAAVGFAAALLAPEPAGACEVSCEEEYESWRLELVEVEIVDDGGDTDAEDPVWAETARLDYDSLQITAGEEVLELAP